MHIVMLAAENGALKGGKVGGIGDVIRDVPRALEKCGHRVSVLTPGYQLLARINPSARLSEFTVEFCGVHESLELFAADVSSRRDETEGTRGQVNYYIVDHPLFAACGAGSIYCNDLNGPFATDAHKFALFCAAACELLSAGSLGQVDVVHLHDWHAAMFAVLRRFVPAWRDLYRIPLVYTIHNLSLQGVRPLSVSTRNRASHRKASTSISRAKAGMTTNRRGAFIGAFWWCVDAVASGPTRLATSGADKRVSRVYMPPHIVRPASNGVVQSGGRGWPAAFLLDRAR